MNDTVRIFVGCASNNEDIESQLVLEHTLRKFASQPIEIEWMQLSRDRSSFWYASAREGWNTTTWTTPFSAFRWAVPERCGFKGRAIYMDSDMIARADIAILWNTPIERNKVLVARDDTRFCVTLFDCESVRPYMKPLQQLRSDPAAYRAQRKAFGGGIQRFRPDQNWNCLDGEQYATLDHPDIKCIHYTAIPTQPQLRYALKRAAQEGAKHWFRGQHRPHPRKDIEALFDAEMAEAIACGGSIEQYRKPPFGDYGAGCYGGGYAR